ncbi:MAG: 4Fe-4S dicluster domain-containing protein [Prevotellaceae bacterium]|jgi:heterodisulfide reductase subunit C|nr:4Fe-4S dicluster domain-containing protein [Prevotellaceae bacterium]
MSSKFGYTKLDSGTVNLDNANFDVAKKVAQQERSFTYCIACGSCTATCSAGNFTEYNLRKIQLMVRRGEVEPLRETITRCMLCGKCQMVCPKGVSTRNVVLQISKLLKQPVAKEQLTDKLHPTDDRKI